VLNLAVASALDDLCTALEARLPAQRPSRDANGHTTVFHAALQDVLRETITTHSRVVFDGDGYAREWAAEATRRGLPNLSDTPAALEALLDPDTATLFEKYGVLSARELQSRHTVHHEAWERTVRMEGYCALDLARTFILPSALAWETRLATAAETAERMGRTSPVHRQLYERVAGQTENFQLAIDELDAALADEQSPSFVVAALDKTRAASDALESMTPDRDWPFPCYGELFFGY
jgi:glutamine synthetase